MHGWSMVGPPLPRVTTAVSSVGLPTISQPACQPSDSLRHLGCYANRKAEQQLKVPLCYRLRLGKA